MSVFYNLSIKNKLIGIILFVTILALGLGFTLVIVSDIKSFKEDMKSQTVVTAQVISEYCVSPLVFKDNAGAEQILAKLADVPAIIRAKVYDTNGELFAEFASSEEPEIRSPIVRERLSEFVDNYLYVSQPILYKDENYGTIYLQASTQLLNAKIRAYLRYMVLLMAGLTMISVFLALRLQHIISKPILNLAEVARQVAKEENYSVRAEKKGDDEIGFLYDGFNNMLEQIQNREIERDKAEYALRESEEKFRSLTSNIPGAVYRCANDPDWTMDFISDVIEEISGYNASDFIQNRVRTFPSIIHPDDRKMVRETAHEAISKRVPYIIEYRIIRSDGNIRWVYEKGQGIFSDDGILLWLDGAIFDITERKQAEEELAQHREHLEELVETRTKELKEKQAQLIQSSKMAALGSLVAGVAHEINTPVGAINSMHNTLMKAFERLKAEMEKSLQKTHREHKNINKSLKIIEDADRVIQSGTQRVIDIVRRLRSFARLDQAELKNADINEGLEDTLTIVHHEIKHNIKVIRNYGDIQKISCFPGRLNQVFLNLLINAKQAIKNNGEITVTSYSKNNKVYVEIKDNGEGIPEKNINKIFDPGFTTRGVGVGTGLGLSICYQIMQDHLGEILVESEAGKGTTFTLVLPTDLEKKLNLDSPRSKV
ncbi:MAG: PAS domain-containing protein [Thermoplasmata archaeon]|nr:MAG: PAS domain-containing protein [Thermoplasmata archaeon]